MERYIVIDNYCGWPKLTLLPDGSLIANVHNRPSHGSADGYPECWKSLDGGRTFKYEGRPVEPVKYHPHIDRAAGLCHNGDYITVLDDRGVGSHELTIARSKDGCKTFETVTDSYGIPGKPGVYIEPYGEVVRIGEKKLAFTCFAAHDPATYKGFGNSPHDAYFCVSEDDGCTWNEPQKIDYGINEVALCFYDELNGIAIGRIDASGRENRLETRTGGAGNMLYRTSDGGKSWVYESQLFGVGITPTHLTLLSNGDTLVTAGVRFANRHGIIAALSRDRGESWYEPTILVEYPATDSGYPSTVQMPDGSLVTAFYSRGNMYHTRYHVGTILWTLDDLLISAWRNGVGVVTIRAESEEIIENRWEIL